MEACNCKVLPCQEGGYCCTVIMFSTHLATSLCGTAVRKGDRIAQLILERIMTPEVEEVDDLDSTVRGSGGYGSTGTAK